MYDILNYIWDVLLIIFTIATCNTIGANKYLVIILLSILLLCLGRKKKWDPWTLLLLSMPMFTYLIFGGVSTFLSGGIQTTTIKVVLFWCVPFLFSFALYVYYGEKMCRIVDLQFASCSILYAIPKARLIIESGVAESTFAFVFGLYVIYYFYKKNWICTALAMILMYWSDKRIVMLAAGIGILIMIFVKIFKNHKGLIVAIWGCVSCFVLIYIWLICSGTLNYFCQGIGINTNGRLKMYSNMMEWFHESIMISGNGLGIVEKILECWNVYAFNNLHNDLLKFYIEIGVLGLCFYLISYGVVLWLTEKKYGNNVISLLLSTFIYSIVLFATDNVSIYILYLIPLYSIYFAVLAKKEKRVVV